MAHKEHFSSGSDVTFVPVSHSCHSLTSLETVKGRRNNLTLILVVALLPLLTLFIQNIINVNNNTSDVAFTASVRDDIMFTIQTGDAIHNVQIERGKTALYVSSGLDPSFRTVLDKNRRLLNDAVHNLTQWPETCHPAYFKNKTTFIERVESFRSGINSSTTVKEVLDFYSEGISTMIRWVSTLIKRARGGSLWPVMVGYHMLMVAKENAGIERAIGSTFFAQGYLSQDALNAYVKQKVLRETYMERSGEYDPSIHNYMKSHFVNSTLDRYIALMVSRILRNSETNASTGLGELWFNNMTLYINTLKQAQDLVALNIVAILSAQVNELQNGLVFSIVLMVVALLLTPFVIGCIKRLADRIQNYATTLRQKTRDLEVERKRSQALLFELLPVTVAQKMIQQEPIDPESYQSVTIYFSDIVDFTYISSNSSPLQVVNMLNMLYEMFDNQLELFDVYKVETIGDAYMVVSGLPQRNGERHCMEIAGLALELLTIISHTSVPHIPDRKLQLRIGLNTGPVVAGVVGTKMPRYCIFGDTVNVASRMESYSLPGRIQISETTKKGLDVLGGFVMRDRGLVDIKGKGRMHTHWLVGRTGVAATSPSSCSRTGVISCSNW
ncbi:uncharacterized protein LOC121385829 [Gigantopelta aegis]|uniref:uncharacterized protein LOC121385829 n=1 Tax=Gigantopelta aegis TaxID=1735272 RepID=UPI001B88B44D|nr:uncharacterized protein LOC121385829 [Gigantopelta aegis]